MAHRPIDITPNPQVLVALTRTPILPIDALSELIDNAVDSFRTAATSGAPSAVRQVIIEVPGPAEVARAEGMIRVRDTGPGLTESQIANSMRAYYTSKNHYDTLGLFGMGFNIATGKLGRITRVISARAEDDHAVQVTLDLPELMQSQTFSARAEQIEDRRACATGQWSRSGAGGRTATPTAASSESSRRCRRRPCAVGSGGGTPACCDRGRQTRW